MVEMSCQRSVFEPLQNSFFKTIPVSDNLIFGDKAEFSDSAKMLMKSKNNPQKKLDAKPILPVCMIMLTSRKISKIPRLAKIIRVVLIGNRV